MRLMTLTINRYVFGREEKKREACEPCGAKEDKSRDEDEEVESRNRGENRLDP
jgi:hypothetical protein